MGLHPTIDYELAATLVATGMTYDAVAKQCGGKSGQTIRQGLIRRGTTALRLRAANYVTPSTETVTAKLAKDASALLRKSLGNTLGKHAAALEAIPAKPNLQHIKAVGEALEPLARTGKIVHDWGSDDKSTLIAVGLVGQWDSAQDALEVQSSVAEATTGSVLEQPTSDNTPQSAQDVEPQQ